MKSSNNVSLNLELLEDRLAPSGAFHGAIDVGPPSYPPLNASPPSSTTAGQTFPGFQGSFANFNSGPANAFQSFQSQMQALQAAQVALVDQYFSQMQSLLQQLHINTFLII